MNQTQKRTRREVLEEFVAAHPNDAFARYGLAVECGNQGENTAAIAHFYKLMAAHPDYVTGYIQYGQLLARLSRIDAARKRLSDGIEAARRTGDQHALSEMEGALAQL